MSPLSLLLEPALAAQAAMLCASLGVGFAAASPGPTPSQQNSPVQTVGGGDTEEAGDELVDLVAGLLADKDKEMRALGLEQVRTGVKGAAATRKLAALLPNLPADAQAGLLSALADRGDPAARPAVLAALAAARDPQVRTAAIAALGFLGEPADVNVLAASLESQYGGERAAARASLVRLKDAAGTMARSLGEKQRSPAVRGSLIDILAARRAKETLPEILAAALDADSAVRTAAMAALGELAGPEQLPGMVQGVLRAEKGAERTAAERAVALVCSRNPDPDGRAAPLLAAMDRLSAAERLAVLPAVGRVGGSVARAAIQSAVADPSPQVHESGLRALCNWPDASVAPQLLELHQTEAIPELRSMLRAALIRVAPLPDQRSPAEKLALVRKTLALCTRDQERTLLLKRAPAIRSVETLRFLLPFLDEAPYAQQACESIVELAHHRELRETNKSEFHRALDRVIELSKDATVVERANRYKRNQTWARPRPADAP